MRLAFPILLVHLLQVAFCGVIKVPFRRRSGLRGRTGVEDVQASQSVADYVVDISIGTPSQRFSIQVLTSLSYTWVADSSCKCPAICSLSVSCATGFCDDNSECCDNEFGSDIAKRTPKERFQSLALPDHVGDAFLPPLNSDRGTAQCNPKRVLFHSSKSSTYRKSGINFNNTGVWDGFGPPQSSGFTGIDNISLGSLSIKEALFGQAVRIHMDSEIDGVLGLAPAAASPSGIDSLVVSAFKKGIIDQPIATFWIANATVDSLDDPAVIGEITYGGVDSDNCGPVPVYHPISSFSHNGRAGWFVKGTVSIGTATISPPQIHVDFTPGLFLDDAYLKELLKGIPGVTDGDYFPCTTKFNMKLTIDGHDYVLPSDVIVDTADRQGKFCRLMAESGGHGQFTIGESFLLMFCRSLDIGNNRIGFAQNLNIACDPRQPNNHCPGTRFGR